MNVGIFLALDWTFVFVMYLMILFQILCYLLRDNRSCPFLIAAGNAPHTAGSDQ